MLIKDGNRLICVTENEEMKQKLIELDGGDLIQAPLSPLPNASPVIPYDSDVLSDAKIKLAKGIDGVMEVYNSITSMPASRDKKDIIELTKKEIAKYLKNTENNGTETLRKFNEEIKGFIKPTLIEVLNEYLYDSVELLLEFESESVHKRICEKIIFQGLERCKT